MKFIFYCLVIFLFLTFPSSLAQRAFMGWVTELAKCYTPGVLYEDDVCNDCVGKCITENVDPATGFQFAQGHQRPNCDFCRRACYAMHARSCAYTTGYMTGIPCSEWGAVGYCV